MVRAMSENAEFESEVEQDGPCPECGRGVHEDGHHALSCSKRTDEYVDADKEVWE